MTVEGGSGRDPAVCMADSALRRADLAINNPASDLIRAVRRVPPSRRAIWMLLGVPFCDFGALIVTSGHS